MRQLVPLRARRHPHRAHPVAATRIVAGLPHDRFLAADARVGGLVERGACGDARGVHVAVAGDRRARLCSTTWLTTVTDARARVLPLRRGGAVRAAGAQRAEAGHAQERRGPGTVGQRERGREHPAVALHDLAVLDLARHDRGVAVVVGPDRAVLDLRGRDRIGGELRVAHGAVADLRAGDGVVGEVAVADRAAAHLRARDGVVAEIGVADAGVADLQAGDCAGHDLGGDDAVAREVDAPHLAVADLRARDRVGLDLLGADAHDRVGRAAECHDKCDERDAHARAKVVESRLACSFLPLVPASDGRDDETQPGTRMCPIREGFLRKNDVGVLPARPLRGVRMRV